MSEMREEQINRMVSEGKISPEEGTRLLEALARSRSGEAELEIARKAGKKPVGRRPLYLALIIVSAALLATGLTLGLYFGLRNTESAGKLFVKGEEAFAAGDYDEAIRLYSAGLDKEPGSSPGYNLLGMACRFKYNQTADARYRQKEIRAFEKSIELDPGNYMPLVNLGATLFYQDQKDEAAPYFRKALELYPGNPERAAIEEMIKQAE